jgi:hypothetical protein
MPVGMVADNVTVYPRPLYYVQSEDEKNLVVYEVYVTHEGKYAIVSPRMYTDYPNPYKVSRKTVEDTGIYITTCRDGTPTAIRPAHQWERSHPGKIGAESMHELAAQIDGPYNGDYTLYEKNDVYWKDTFGSPEYVNSINTLKKLYFSGHIEEAISMAPHTRDLLEKILLPGGQ